MKFKSPQGGTTLLELIIAVGVFGIFTLILGSVYTNFDKFKLCWSKKPIPRTTLLLSLKPARAYYKSIADPTITINPNANDPLVPDRDVDIVWEDNKPIGINMLIQGGAGAGGMDITVTNVCRPWPMGAGKPADLADSPRKPQLRARICPRSGHA